VLRRLVVGYLEYGDKVEGRSNHRDGTVMADGKFTATESTAFRLVQYCQQCRK